MTAQTLIEKLQLQDEKNLLIQGLPSSIEKQFVKLTFSKSVTPLLKTRKIDFALVFAEGEDIDFLLLGTGAAMSRPAKPIIEIFARQNLPLDFMSTGSAVRTYGVLLAEKRKVAAAFIAVQDAV